MRRKVGLFLSVAASCTLVAACFGGGDGGDPAPTPTPTPTASPSPTPTPTPAPVDFDFTKAFSDSVTNASYVFAYFMPTGGAETWSDGTRQAGTSTITYAVAPESVSFVWPDGSTLPGFVEADRQTATTTLRTYRKGTDALTLELPFQNVLRATYERVQSFTSETVPGMLRSNRVTLFFNEVTTTAAIAANLVYTGTAQVAGGTPKSTPPGVFSAAPTTLTVTASDKKITGSIQILENVNGTPTVRATLPLSATLGTGDGFNAAIDDTSSGFKGTFVGALAGPNREEAFIIFNVTHTDGRELIGSLIAG
ncbi:MAG: hypothetical protein ACK4NZ_09220 [Tsuneonella sp.]